MRRLLRIGFPIMLVATVWLLMAGRQASSAPSFVSTGDGGWEWVKPLPCLHDLERVFFLDDHTGWVIGGSVMLKTTDGGRNWAPQGKWSGMRLFDVCFTDAKQGFAVGAFLEPETTGFIARTDNGGASWRIVHKGRIPTLRSVCFVSSRTGWAFGGRLFKTIDGGETWTEQHPAGQSGDVAIKYIFPPNHISFVDEKIGWVLGPKRELYKTADGGSSWTMVPLPQKSRIRGVQFVDASTGWVLAGKTIMRTTDGGKSWTEHGVPVRVNCWHFHFSDPLNGIVVEALDGLIHKTSDGGKTWTSANPPSGPAQYPTVCMADQRNGWVAAKNGVILRTSDGGKSWQEQSWGSRDSVADVRFADGKTGWAAGSNGLVSGAPELAPVILKTTDGGQIWDRKTCGIRTSLYAVSFPTDTNGWGVGAFGAVISTKDGGNTWRAQDSGTDVGLSDVHFSDPSNGWAVGNYRQTANGGYERAPTMVRTGDGGDTWSQVALPAGFQSIEAVFSLSAKTGWIVGDSGRMFRTTDGGLTWRRQVTGTSQTLADVVFLNEKVGWTCGGLGTMLKTEDGGDSWVRQTTGTESSLRSVHFLDELTGWAAGGGIVRTTDGGKTWSPQDTGAPYGPLSVYFADRDNGWAASGYGILRTTTGGLPGAVWAKKQEDGKQADFGHLVVTKKSEGYLLAEHPDSRIGIHIKTSDDKPSIGDYIYVHGKVATEDGEKIIAADSVDIVCAGWGVLPEKGVGL